MKGRLGALTKFVAIIKALLHEGEELTEEGVLVRLVQLVQRVKQHHDCDVDILTKLERLLGVSPEGLYRRVMELKHRERA
jgi:hypothetical protein